MNALEARLAKEAVLAIDGGLATEIEAKGVNIVSEVDAVAMIEVPLYWLATYIVR